MTVGTWAVPQGIWMKEKEARVTCETLGLIQKVWELWSLSWEGTLVGLSNCVVGILAVNSKLGFLNSPSILTAILIA
jgi:hypothetical protein